eukprot:gb/GECG01012384.1/.p1 GENE.gb/GECG01012384.1/~~gb/GECG01012384.1/.p1  ORF type:complete len:983 (+),score=137.67 gb/GECG01012384.1/:1-2949(+)
MSDSDTHTSGSPTHKEESEDIPEESLDEEAREQTVGESKEVEGDGSTTPEPVLEDKAEDSWGDDNHTTSNSSEHLERKGGSARSVRDVELSHTVSASDTGTTTEEAATAVAGTGTAVSQQESNAYTANNVSATTPTVADEQNAAVQSNVTHTGSGIAEHEYGSFETQDLPSPHYSATSAQQGTESETNGANEAESRNHAFSEQEQKEADKRHQGLPPLSSRGCIGSFVHRGSHWEEYQNLVYEEQKAAGAPGSQDGRYKARTLGEDGGTKGRGIIVERAQVSLAGRDAETLQKAQGNDLQVDLVAVLWEYGALQWYPWSRFDAQDNQGDGPDSKVFQVVTLLTTDPQQLPDRNLFIAKAVLKCFERNLLPQVHRRHGTNVRQYLKQRSSQSLDALSGKAALVRMEDRKYWHTFVASTQEYASLSHLMNILVYTFQWGFLPIHWLAFHRQWHNAAARLSHRQVNPETVRQKLAHSKLEDAAPRELFSSLSRQEQFSSLLLEIISRIDQRALSKLWKRAGSTFPANFDYSMSSSLREAFSQLSSNRSLCVHALESFVDATSFPWDIPVLTGFTEKLKRSLAELESAIPPQNFQVGFQRKELSVVGERRRQFLIMLERVSCPPDLLAPLRMLRYSIVPEGFFEEWILFKGERWYMELQNLESQASRLPPRQDYSKDANSKMVGSLILELGDNLKEIAPWKEKWPEKFDESGVYYVPYVAPLQTSLHEDLLVHVAPSKEVRCCNRDCQRAISPKDPYACFQTVGGHIHHLGNEGLATESQLDLLPEGFEDRYFCTNCVLTHLGITQGERVERNEDEWEYPDHDGGKGGTGYVSRVLGRDWMGLVEVCWDVRPTEAFSYTFGSRGTFEVKPVTFDRGEQVCILKDLQEAKVRYDMFCNSIFHDNLANTRITERHWGMIHEQTGTVVESRRCSDGVPVANIQFDRVTKVFWLPVAALEKTHEDDRVPSRERAKRRSQVQPEQTSYQTA